MDKQRLFIIGTSSTAVHLYQFVQEYELFDIQGFAVDRDYLTDSQFLGLPVYAIEDLPLVVDKDNDLLYVAIMWNHLNGDRRRMYERLKAQGFHFANVLSPTAKVRGTLQGENCWLHDYVIVQDHAVIGADTMIMAYALIGSYVTMGPHCFCAAKCTIGGKCSIGEQCFIGIGSTVFDERIVGNKCVVGAGVNLNRSLPDFSVSKIAPESFVSKQYEEEVIESKLMFSKNVK